MLFRSLGFRSSVASVPTVVTAAANKFLQIRPRAGFLGCYQSWIWVDGVPSERVMAVVTFSWWILFLFLHRRNGVCSFAVVELWRSYAGASYRGMLVLLQGLWRMVGGSRVLLRRRRRTTLDPEPRVHGGIPRPTCHSERCSAACSGPFFGSQSFSAMVLRRLFGARFSSPLPLAASAAMEDRGVRWWFSFLAVAVVLVSSLVSSGFLRVCACVVHLFYPE